MIRKSAWLGLCLCVGSCVYGADTVFLGPTNLRVSDQGEFSWVDTTPKP